MKRSLALFLAIGLVACAGFWVPTFGGDIELARVQVTRFCRLTFLAVSG